MVLGRAAPDGESVSPGLPGRAGVLGPERATSGALLRLHPAEGLLAPAHRQPWRRHGGRGGAGFHCSVQHFHYHYQQFHLHSLERK